LGTFASCHPRPRSNSSHCFSRHGRSRNLFLHASEPIRLRLCERMGRPFETGLPDILSRFSSQRRGKPPRYCGARPLMFRSISIHLHSPVPIREASEVYHHTMKAPNPRYEGSLNLPGHTSLTQRCEKSEEGASPSSPGEQPGRPSFQCTLCPERKPYTQKQVLKRHYEKEHQPNSLINCSHCNHKWTRSREYDFRRHLKKKHGLEDNKINEILGRPPRRRRRKGRVIESDSPPHFSPASIERDRQSLAESQQRPLMLPLLAVRKDANHTSPPLIPSMVYNPRLGHAEPKVTATEHEDSSELEHLAATHAPKILSDEGFARLRSYLKIHGRIRFVHTFFICDICDRLCSQNSVSLPMGIHFHRHPTQPRDATYPRTLLSSWWISYQPGFRGSYG
jgi:hypothetical protein